MRHKATLAMITLVVFNIFLIFQNYAYQNDVTSLEAAIQLDKNAVHSLERMKLISGLENKDEHIATLFIFIQADGECHCIDDWGYWKKALEQPGLRVIGIFNGESAEKVIDFAKGVDLEMPIYIDPERQIQTYYHVPPNKIAKILTDNSGQVLFADSNQTSEKNHKEFLRRVLEHVDILDN